MNAPKYISGEDFRVFAVRILERVGLPNCQATDTAKVLLWTSLRGIDTHGVRNLKRYYVDGVLDGTVEPTAELRIESETPLAARTDGDAGMGPAAGCWGMRMAIEKAIHAGMGFVVMRNSNHLGAAGYYAHMAVDHDMIGLCMTGYLFAHGANVGVLPLFGSTPMLGTNPMAVAFPCDAFPPFVFDMATSISPMNRIEMFHEAGKSIPLGWGLDENGQPTSDLAALKFLLPLGGTSEQGGHKGFGLALMVQALVGVLSGAWCDAPTPERILGNKPGVQTGYAQDGIGHFFGAMRIDQFGPTAEFKRGMDATIEAIHRSAREPGQQRIYVPGEMEHATEQMRRRIGIPIPENVVADLQSLSQKYDVPLRLSSGSAAP